MARWELAGYHKGPRFLVKTWRKRWFRDCSMWKSQNRATVTQPSLVCLCFYLVSGVKLNKWILKETLRYCVWCENPRIALLRSLTQVWCLCSYLLAKAVTSLPLFRSITDIRPNMAWKKGLGKGSDWNEDQGTSHICSNLDPSLISHKHWWCQLEKRDRGKGQ